MTRLMDPFSVVLKNVLSVSLTVCSTTLWVGQLDKRTQQHDVASLLEEFGEIESINVSFDVYRSVYALCLL